MRSTRVYHAVQRPQPACARAAQAGPNSGPTRSEAGMPTEWPQAVGQTLVGSKSLCLDRGSPDLSSADARAERGRSGLRRDQQRKDGSEVCYLQFAHNQWDPVGRQTKADVIHSFGSEGQLDREAIKPLTPVRVQPPGPESTDGVRLLAADPLPQARPSLLGCHLLWKSGKASPTTGQCVGTAPEDGASLTRARQRGGYFGAGIGMI